MNDRTFLKTAPRDNEPGGNDALVEAVRAVIAAAAEKEARAARAAAIDIPGLVTHDLGGYALLQGRLPDDLLWDEAAFDAAWALHPEERPEIHLHGKKVKIPRWQQAYGRNYRFSGQTSEALPVPEPFAPLLEWAQEAIDPRLNGVLLNWYDSTHYIGAHHDSVKDMHRGAPIVTVSFGETRVFRLTPGRKAEGEKRDIPAPAGTVFVMPYDTNLAWKHEVVKSARHKARRISVTFRAFEG